MTMRIVRLEGRKRDYRRPKLVVQFTCDHCGKEIEQNGMLLWKGDGEEFKILHSYCTPSYDYLPKSEPLDYVSITEVRNE